MDVMNVTHWFAFRLDWVIWSAISGVHTRNRRSMLVVYHSSKFLQFSFVQGKLCPVSIFCCCYFLYTNRHFIKIYNCCLYLFPLFCFFRALWISRCLCQTKTFEEEKYCQGLGNPDCLKNNLYFFLVHHTHPASFASLLVWNVECLDRGDTRRVQFSVCPYPGTILPSLSPSIFWPGVSNKQVKSSPTFNPWFREHNFPPPVRISYITGMRGDKNGRDAIFLRPREDEHLSNRCFQCKIVHLFHIDSIYLCTV